MSITQAALAAPPRRSKWSITKGERKNIFIGLAFISPWIFGFLVFLIYPIIYSFQLSFTRYGGILPPEPIGWANYTRMWNDEVFWIAMRATFTYAALAVPIGVVMAMAIAIAMDQPMREIPLYRTVLFLPSVLPLFATSFVFMVLLNPNTGIVNQILRSIGLNPPNWFGDPNWANFSIVLMAQMGAGQVALIFLAGLRGIPPHLYESAQLDGASWAQRFRNITLPLMTPIILYDLIIGISGGIQVFTQAYIITDGGPARSTTYLVFYLYNNAFKYSMQMGYASALGVVIFLLTLVLAGITFLTSKKWVTYDLT
ncbi:MAG: sugar ABC transporter permease [Thermomicrobiales bacterium]|nr:sugar ABC transporter permease [Thermomicrobiales bacterium]